jgi:ubiquitin carboxyl-terminal hydrolase 10
MCFANAVSQLLVHSPLFWNLFRELEYLKGQRGAGGLETVGGATPMVDATMRFFEEFMLKEKETLQQAAGGKPREDEEAKRGHNVVDSFEPMYMYDAMKETRQLKTLLVRSRAT